MGEIRFAKCRFPFWNPISATLPVASDSNSPGNFLGYPIFFLRFKLGISQVFGPPIFGISQLFSNCNLGISQLFLRVVLQIVRNKSWDIPIFSPSSFCKSMSQTKNSSGLRHFSNRSCGLIGGFCSL